MNCTNEISSFGDEFTNEINQVKIDQMHDYELKPKFKLAGAAKTPRLIDGAQTPIDALDP